MTFAIGLGTSWRGFSLLLFVAAAASAAHGAPDPATGRTAWEAFVAAEIKQQDSHVWKPADTPIMVQFGYDYCSQHDPMWSQSGVDEVATTDLARQLVGKGVPVDDAHGAQIVDVFAAEAQRDLCPGR